MRRHHYHNHQHYKVQTVTADALNLSEHIHHIRHRSH